MTDIPAGPAPLPALPCGRDPEALVVQVADGLPLDDHQRECRYCRAALTELEGLWAPVRAVAGHRPAAPDGALDDALRTLREVAGRVVVVLARHLAAGVPGVRAALSRVRAGAAPAVEITLAATYGVDLAALGERIRATVARGIREHTGLEVVAVDVVIDEVLDDVLDA